MIIVVVVVELPIIGGEPFLAKKSQKIAEFPRQETANYRLVIARLKLGFVSRFDKNCVTAEPNKYSLELRLLGFVFKSDFLNVPRLAHEVDPRGRKRPGT